MMVMGIGFSFSKQTRANRFRLKRLALERSHVLSSCVVWRIQSPKTPLRQVANSQQAFVDEIGRSDLGGCSGDLMILRIAPLILCSAN